LRRSLQPFALLQCPAFSFVVAAAPALVVLAGMLVFVPFRLNGLLYLWIPGVTRNHRVTVVQSLIAVGSAAFTDGFAAVSKSCSFCRLRTPTLSLRSLARNWVWLGVDRSTRVCALSVAWFACGTAGADRFGMLLGMGIVSSIVLQALFNISVVLSLVPNKGIPLPFISYAGRHLCNAFCRRSAFEHFAIC